MVEEKLVEKIKLCKKITELSIIFLFFFCGAIAYLIVNYLDDRLENTSRALILLPIILWVAAWLFLLFLSSRIIKKKMGLLCKKCGKVCYTCRGLKEGVSETTFTSTGKCNYCGEVLFEIS